MANVKAKDFKKDDSKPNFMDTEQKIRRGQAYNLAVQAAIAKATFEAPAGEFDTVALNKKEIFSYFVFYYELGAIAQTYSFEEIKKVIE